ncbi:hypothetical protein [Pseudomonas sp. LRF_L74]|uniref:hypothetical protein n=1 Tax=Pseudomonas sp. LRF_L74 TaxID=3369422 RepID=UPI003F646FE9
MTALDPLLITREWPAPHPERLQPYSRYEAHKAGFDTQEPFPPAFLARPALERGLKVPS